MYPLLTGTSNNAGILHRISVDLLILGLYNDAFNPIGYTLGGFSVPSIFTLCSPAQQTLYSLTRKH
jgi:hypothetical protein